MSIGRGLGLAALAMAIVAIFVPLAGILISVGAILLAIAAALNREYGLAAGTSGVVALNSVLLSPTLWIMTPPGQLIVLGFVLCLAAAPLGAIALTERCPRFRYAIVLSVGWMLVAPLAVNDRVENSRSERFTIADVACMRRHPSPHAPDVNKLCYDEGAAARDATPPASPAMLTAVALAPVALAWLGYLLFYRRRAPAPGIPEPRG
jgi:hypothetical protein